MGYSAVAWAARLVFIVYLLCVVDSWKMTQQDAKNKALHMFPI
jgi:hypothetical protein